MKFILLKTIATDGLPPIGECLSVFNGKTWMRATYLGDTNGSKPWVFDNGGMSGPGFAKEVKAYAVMSEVHEAPSWGEIFKINGWTWPKIKW